MAEAYKLLGNVLLGVAATTIYTVPGTTAVIVRHIVVTSTQDNQNVVVNGPSSAPIIGACLLNNGEWAEWDGALTLAAAAVIQGLTTTANGVRAAAYGVEIT